MKDIINKQIYDESIKHFMGQQTDEKIVYCFNQHWITIIWRIIRLFIVTVFFISLVFLVYILFMSDNLTRDVARWLAVIFIFTYVYYFHSRIAYIFDAIMKLYIVSNRRLVCIDKSLFFKDNKEILDLKKIQDISSSKAGFWSNVLGYGNIEITLSSTSKIKIINFVPSPDEIVEIIDRTKRIEIEKDGAEIIADIINEDASR
jgi:hypothetical protein